MSAQRKSEHDSPPCIVAEICESCSLILWLYMQLFKGMMNAGFGYKKVIHPLVSKSPSSGRGPSSSMGRNVWACPWSVCTFLLLERESYLVENVPIWLPGHSRVLLFLPEHCKATFWAARTHFIVAFKSHVYLQFYICHLIFPCPIPSYNGVTNWASRLSCSNPSTMPKKSLKRSMQVSWVPAPPVCHMVKMICSIFEIMCLK